MEPMQHDDRHVAARIIILRMQGHAVKRRCRLGAVPQMGLPEIIPVLPGIEKRRRLLLRIEQAVVKADRLLRCAGIAHEPVKIRIYDRAEPHERNGSKHKRDAKYNDLGVALRAFRILLFFLA